MRIGIFGGSFDPVHLGHLILAEHCREAAGLDQVLLVPTATSPLKPDGPFGKPRQRIEMLQLATAGHGEMVVSSIELDRGETSYTIDTLKALQVEKPNDELFLLMGADALETFAQWRDPDEICRIATPLVVGRRGHDVDVEKLKPHCDDGRFSAIKDAQISDLPLIEISSTEIRQAIQGQKSIRYLTPRPVEMYILTNKIYC